VIRRLLPLIIFFVLIGFLAQSLYESETELPSPLIGKPIPEFKLRNLITEEFVTNDQIIGNISLINVWATWCVGCEIEHEFLVELSQDRNLNLPIIGLNWKDDDQLAKLWLKQLGDPYILVLKDPEGKTAIDFGVYGAPETFLIDSNGIIHFKHIGPLDREIYEQDILPLIGELN